MNHHIPSPPLLFYFPTQGTLDQSNSNCSWCTVRQLCQLTKPSQLLTINAQATIDLNFKHRNTNSTNFNLYSVDRSHRFSYKKESLREKLYSQLFLHPPGVYPLDVQQVGELNSPYVNISGHIVSMEISSLHGLPLYVWVFGVVGWLAHLGKLGWSTLCIHFPCIHFALAPWCILPGWRACVCAQGRRWFPHLRREPRASRPTVTCLEQSAPACPA